MMYLLDLYSVACPVHSCHTSPCYYCALSPTYQVQDIDNCICLITAWWLLVDAGRQGGGCNGERTFLYLVLLSSSIVFYRCMVCASTYASESSLCRPRVSRYQVCIRFSWCRHNLYLLTCVTDCARKVLPVLASLVRRCYVGTLKVSRSS